MSKALVTVRKTVRIIRISDVIRTVIETDLDRNTRIGTTAINGSLVRTNTI
jgi:hypothetical protein